MLILLYKILSTLLYLLSVVWLLGSNNYFIMQKRSMSTDVSLHC
jgi:hypothetical protein